MNNLLTKCNADVFKAILDIKDKNPSFGERIISILQNHESHFDLTLGDMLWFSAHLPRKIWDGKAHTFHFLFQSQPTTEMP